MEPLETQDQAELPPESKTKPPPKRRAKSSAKSQPKSRIKATSDLSNEMSEPETQIPVSTETKLLHAQTADLKKAKQWKEITELLWKNIEKLDEKLMADLAEAHFYRNQFSEVNRVSQLALAKRPKNYLVLTWLAKTQLQLNKVNDARGTLVKALQAKSDYMPAIELLDQIYLKQKNYYELRILYQDLIAEKGSNPKYLAKLCAINTLDGVNEAALKTCEEAKVKDPRNYANLLNIAKVYDQTQEPEKAKLQFITAVKLFPKQEEVYFEYASYLERQKNNIDAVVNYEKCTIIKDSSERCWEGLGRTAIQVQKPELSYKALVKACSFGSKYTSTVRYAWGVLVRSQVHEWKEKFSELAETCKNR